MKKIFVALFLLFTIMFANAGNMAVGLLAGYPDALTARLDMNKMSFDAYIGWDYWDMWLAGDIIMKKPMKFQEIPLEMYYGGGGMITFGSHDYWEYDATVGYWRWVQKTDINLGLRGKVGLSYYFSDDHKLSAFIETGPGLFFIHFEFNWFGGAGIRYYF